MATLHKGDIIIIIIIIIMIIIKYKFGTMCVK